MSSGATGTITFADGSTLAFDSVERIDWSDHVNFGGDDVRFADAAGDTVTGTSNDDLDGDGGRDFLDGGTGMDTLHGDSGDDYLVGGADDDLLDGGTGDDTLMGEKGEDFLIGGAGNDYLDGGDGDDTLVYDDDGRAAGRLR